MRSRGGAAIAAAIAASLAAAGALLALAPVRIVGAQAVPQPTVRVVVTDSAGAPVAGVEVALVRGLRDSVGRGTTNDAGQAEFKITSDQNQYQVIARKISYYRAERFFIARAVDTIRTNVTMRRVVQALETVRVTEREDLQHRAYFIDADVIANSTRNLIDASDILLKLRPDMVAGRPAPGFDPDCNGMREIWVNGRRSWAAMGIVNPRATQRMLGQTGRRGQQPPVGKLGPSNLSILLEIKPEHIAEMAFKDCFDTTVEGTGKKNALFVVLKPGVGYRQGVGTYVVDAVSPAPKRP